MRNKHSLERNRKIELNSSLQLRVEPYKLKILSLSRLRVATLNKIILRHAPGAV